MGRSAEAESNVHVAVESLVISRACVFVCVFLVLLGKYGVQSRGEGERRGMRTPRLDQEEGRRFEVKKPGALLLRSRLRSWRGAHSRDSDRKTLVCRKLRRQWNKEIKDLDLIQPGQVIEVIDLRGLEESEEAAVP